MNEPNRVIQRGEQIIGVVERSRRPEYHLADLRMRMPSELRVSAGRSVESVSKDIVC